LGLITKKQTQNRKLRFLHLLDVLGVGNFRDSIFGWNKKFFSSPKCPSRLSVQAVSCSVSPGVNGINVKLNTHLHITLRWRVGGSIPLLHLHAFITCKLRL